MANYKKKSSQSEFAKKSGCTFKRKEVKDKDGNVLFTYGILFGWNSSKLGLMKFIASKKKSEKKVGDKTIEQKNECYTRDGEVREIWVVKVTFPDKTKKLFTGFYDPAKKVLRMPELEMTANPNTPAGKTTNGVTVSGYWGRNYVK